MSATGPIRLGVLASGRGSNLQALLDAQASGQLRGTVRVVLSDKSEAPALKRAADAGVAASFIDPGSRRARLRPAVEDEMVSALRRHEVEWVVLAGFFRIVGSTLLTAFPDRVLNIHPSLLPSFPGLHAQRQALEYGVQFSGCTVHLVNEDVDGGAILGQSVVPVESADDEDALADRILTREHELLVKTINRIASAGFERRGRQVVWADAT